MKRILSFILCLTMIMSFMAVVNAEHYSKFTIPVIFSQEELIKVL